MDEIDKLVLSNAVLMGSYLLLSLVICAMGYTYYFYNILPQRLIKETNGIPVADFRKLLPYFGSFDLVRKAVAFQAENHPKLGKIFITYFDGDPHVVITGPEIIDQVFVKNAKSIISDWPAAAKSLFGKKSLIAVEGEQHKMQRKVLLGLLGVQVLGSMFPIVVKRFGDAVEQWVEETKDGKFIDVAPRMKNLMWDIMSAIIFGDDCSEELKRSLIEHVKYYAKGISSLKINLPHTDFGKAVAAKRSLVEVIVQEHQRRLKLPNQGADRKDVFQTIINKMSESDNEEFNSDTTMVVLFAAVDSTLGASLRMIDCMIDHAKEWETVHKTVVEVFGKDGVLVPEATYTTLEKECPYVIACVKECMRFTGVGKYLHRRAMEDIEIQCEGKQYLIPKGYKIYLSLHYNSVDPTSIIFKDSTSFIPERFLDPINEDKNPNYRSIITAFGAGERYCPGNPIARLELGIMLCLMSRYKWQRREKVQDWSKHTNAYPSNGLWIRATSV